MKHQSQYRNDCRSWGNILALVLAFFVLPYITDIPYLDDQASTHEAEENSKVEAKAEAGHNKILLVASDVQNSFAVGHGLTLQGIYQRINLPNRGTPSSQRHFHTLIISRPPPIA